MKLLVVAPFNVDFSLQNGESAFRSDKFYDVWEGVSKALPFGDGAFECVNFPKMPNKNGILYSNIKKDSSSGKELFTIKLKSVESYKLSKNNKKLNLLFETFKVERCELQIYDNTIGILRLDVSIKIKKFETQNLSVEVSNAVDEFIKDKIFNKNNKKNLKELLEKIKSKDDKGVFKQNDPYSFSFDRDYFSILWASKAICIEDTQFEKNIEQRGFLKEWLSVVDNKEQEDVFFSSKEASSLFWLRYAFREGANVKEKWGSMFLAQYYYSVIEITMNSLKLAINSSHKPSKIKLAGKDEAILLNNNLSVLIEMANLHIVEYYDVKKYLTRKELSDFNSIMTAWSFDEVLDSVSKLISVAEDRMATVHNKISTKSSFQTDFLLTIVGSLALFDFVFNLYQYSREYSADIMINSQSDDVSFLYFIAKWSTDSVIFWAFGVTLSVVLFYLWHRKKIVQ